MLLQSFAFPQLSLAYFQRHDPMITTDGVLSHRDSRNIRFMRRLNESAENQLRLVIFGIAIRVIVELSRATFMLILQLSVVISSRRLPPRKDVNICLLAES
jgi:hypothetical protein